MEILALIALGIFLGFATVGSCRAQTARAYRIWVPVALAVIAALVCRMVSLSKTGGYLSGIVGTGGMLVMAIAAAGLLLGWIIRRTADGGGVAPHRIWAVAWDAWAVAPLGLACIVAACAE